MSMQGYTGAPDFAPGLAALWRGLSRRSARDARTRSTAPPAWMHASPWSVPPERGPQADGDERAAPPAPTRRQPSADELMDSYFNGLAHGDHVYRSLKQEFDGFCEEAELDAVTDKLFALWLQRRGAVRKRCGKAKVTLYRIGPAPKAKRKGQLGSTKGAKRRGARG